MSAILLLWTAFFAAPAPDIQTEVIQYKQGDQVFEGFLAYDAHIAGKRPGVLVVHEWRGHNDYVRRRAKELARLGYIAFAIDMYGKGVYAKDHEEAGKLAGAFFGDRKLMRTRAQAGFDVLKKHKLTDPTRIVAMGYCFGGTVALELGRSGAPLRGVATFHGNLSTPTPGDAKNIHGSVIAFHGADDTLAGPDQVHAFEDEMRKAKVDWQLVLFGGAVHSFTVPESGNDPKKGMAYDKRADERSWRMFEGFLTEVFH